MTEWKKLVTGITRNASTICSYPVRDRYLTWWAFHQETWWPFKHTRGVNSPSCVPLQARMSRKRSFGVDSPCSNFSLVSTQARNSFRRIGNLALFTKIRANLEAVQPSSLEILFVLSDALHDQCALFNRNKAIRQEFAMFEKQKPEK